MVATMTSSSLFTELSAANPHWPDERVVRAIAEQMVKAGEVEPPVDVELLASLCGIVNIELRSIGPSGMLVKKKRGWVASVLASEGQERQRFTILHEGGHTFLPGFERATHHRCKGPLTREEILCDIAAAEMLFPRTHFTADLEEAGFGMRGVEELSGDYEASIQATARRSVDLSPVPTILLVLSERHKPAERGSELTCEPRLRLDWAHHTGDWPYPKRHKSVSAASPLHEAGVSPGTPGVAAVDELFAAPVGEVELSAAWYGDNLLALARRTGDS